MNLDTNSDAVIAEPKAPIYLEPFVVHHTNEWLSESV